MTLEVLLGLVGAFSLLLATQVQLCKKHLAWLSGWKVIAFSISLGAVEGAVLASVGIQGMDGLNTAPPALGGLVIGVLSGISASGGKDLLTGIGANFAKAQAQAAPTASSVPPTPQQPEDEWREVGLDALLRED